MVNMVERLLKENEELKRENARLNETIRLQDLLINLDDEVIKLLKDDVNIDEQCVII